MTLNTRPIIAPPSPAPVARRRHAALFTTRWLARAGIAGPLLFAFLIAFQDVVQYHYLVAKGVDPLTASPVSDNALGPVGVLQIIAFVAFGLLVIAFARGLHRSVAAGRWSWVSIAFVYGIGVAMVLSGFPEDDYRAVLAHKAVTTWHGAIHNAVFYLFVLTQIAAYIAVGLRCRKDPRWRGYGWYSLALGVLAFPLFILAIALPPVFSWFYVWLLVVPLAWIEILALRLHAYSRDEEKSRAGSC